MNITKQRFFLIALTLFVILGVAFVAFQNIFLTKKTNSSFNSKTFLADTLTAVTGIGMTTSNITTVIPTSTTNKFGISLETKPYGYSDDQMNSTFNDIASLGMGWVRFDLPWSVVQPNNNSTYNWAAVDRIVAAANAHNIKLLPILDYTPRWARPSNCTSSDKCGPANPQAFANFAQQAAIRYSSQGIHTWEIWNEPNITSFWLPSPSTKNYSILLKDSYSAINSVDPSATIISGGLSPAVTSGGNISPVDFLTGMYKNSAEFDAVGMHPYSFPVPPSHFESWNAWSQMSQTSLSLRSLMISHGDADKKIWITEIGAPTGGPGIMATVDNYHISGSTDHVDEALQAEILRDAITSVESYSWVNTLFVYSYKDNGTSQTTVENFFGILRNDGSTKPSYTTLKNILVPQPVVIPSDQNSMPLTPTSENNTVNPDIDGTSLLIHSSNYFSLSWSIIKNYV